MNLTKRIIPCLDIDKGRVVKGIKFKNIEIGSYPFFRLGKVGVSIVMRSTEKNQIDDCSKQILSFIQKKKIQIVGRE